jgi:hypothetical protein
MSQDWQILLGAGSAVKADIWQTSTSLNQFYFGWRESLVQMRKEHGPHFQSPVCVLVFLNTTDPGLRAPLCPWVLFPPNPLLKRMKLESTEGRWLTFYFGNMVYGTHSGLAPKFPGCRSSQIWVNSLQRELRQKGSWCRQEHICGWSRREISISFAVASV